MLDVVTSDDRTALLKAGLKFAKAGKPWAWQWFADRLWPQEFVAQKVNEADGASNATDEFTAAINRIAEAIAVPVDPGTETPSDTATPT